MRLGQLARKYGVSKKEIIAYLKQTDPALHSLGQNSKLDEQTIALLSRQFENPEELFLQPTSAPIPIPIAIGIGIGAEAGKQRGEDEIIETDKLLELLESEESPVDLSKITLIRAPKRELDGLKVVGRIELPEPKPKPAEKKDRTKEPGPGKDHLQPGSPLSVEEREQRRLKAKRRQQEHQARQEKKNKEKEKRQKKALNRTRYQQKLEQAKASQLKPKHHLPKAGTVEVKELPAQPKTLLGKFWRWMTTD